MVLDFEKETEGVLIICLKKGLKKYFADKEFDYDFPDGILPLINSGIVAALITESSEDVKGKVMDEAMNTYKGYKLTGQQNLFIEEEDDLFVLSHAEFTQICHYYKGDVEAFTFRNESISIRNLKAGWAMVFTHVKHRKNSSFMHTITQLTYTNKRFPYPEAVSVPRF